MHGPALCDDIALVIIKSDVIEIGRILPVNQGVKNLLALVDRDILAKLESPLTHLVTNAIDHGIETPEARKTAKKAQKATIRIEAKHVSGMLYVSVADDGSGLNLDLIREKIVSKKLVSPKYLRS